MSSEWPVVRLGDLITLKGGFAYKGEHLGSGEVKLLGMGVVSHSERFLKNGMRSYGGEFPESFRAKSGDLVIATRQQSDNLPILGCPAVIPSDLGDADVVVGTNLYKVTNLSDVCNDFIYWLLRGREYRNRILECSKGTTVRMITKDAVENFKFICPPLHVRRDISQFLDAFDDRITLLRETNTTLEAIAQALFKSWFVDFDPVHAKQQGRAPEGMDAQTAALLPDCFEESELGMVPKGWRVGTLEKIASLNPESWSTKNQPERIYYVDLANTKNNQIDEITEFSYTDAPSRARRVLRLGDVIVGTVRPGNRSFARISFNKKGLTASTGFAVLRAIEEYDQALVYLAATCDDSIERLTHLADGGAYPAVRPEVVLETEVVVPPVEVRRAFGSVANSLLTKIGANQQQAQYLAELRDTLLPRLISGQLRLPEAQALVEDAVVA